MPIRRPFGVRFPATAIDTGSPPASQSQTIRPGSSIQRVTTSSDASPGGSCGSASATNATTHGPTVVTSPRTAVRAAPSGGWAGEITSSSR